MTTLSSLGEWKTISRILKTLGKSKLPLPHKILTGPGDDAAVVNFSTHRPLLLTTDTLIEGTHFRIDWMTKFMSPRDAWRAVGHKSMAVNLSDLAAMGAARPLAALLTFGGGGDISVETVDNLTHGISKISRQFGVSIIGGDTIRSDKTMISITLVGEIVVNNPVLRSGARMGDILMCSGPIGLSGAGLKILRDGRKISPKISSQLLKSHTSPTPRLKESQILGNVDKLTTSMIDLSDDLLTSVNILSEKSGVGFTLDLTDAPVSPALRDFCKADGTLPQSFMLYGGEDYELLFTVKPKSVEFVKKMIPKSFVLGRTEAKRRGITIWMNGKPLRMKDERFRHF